MHCFVLLGVDLVLVSASTLLAVIAADVGPAVSAGVAASAYCAFTLAAATPVILIFGLNRTIWRFTSLSDGTRVTAAAAWIVALTMALASAFGQLERFTLNLPIVQGLLIIHALMGVRIAARIWHDRRRRARRPGAIMDRSRESVLMIGLSPHADVFLYGAAKSTDEKAEIVGILSPSNRHHGRLLRSRKILGSPDAVYEVLHDLTVHGIFVDRIVVALSPNKLSQKAQAALVQLQDSGALRVDWLLAADRRSTPPSDHADAVVWKSGDSPERRPNAYLPWKRLIDATVALACIVVLSPLMLVIAAAVILDVGAPAIFWQQRPGARGKPIKVLKFRTMGAPRDSAGHALADSDRVSPFGRLSRRLRLDELPQIYNVLVGDMSLVGPRPLLPADQPAAPAARLSVRPGLTGWAQIKGGRAVSSEDKAALDLWYIRNASFALDMRIIAQTVRMVLFGERIDGNAIHEAWQAIRADGPPVLPGDMQEHQLG